MDNRLLRDVFLEKFNTEPLLVRSPGRINLIGEHTDYNDGFVLPAAIDKQIVMAMAKNRSGKIRLYSQDFQESVEVDPKNLEPSETTWANYILGVAAQLQKAGHEIGGFDVVFGGDIPPGAGLSSSAALECATGFALNELFKLSLNRKEIAQYGQKAEHEFVGVKCGIMDQFASVMGRKDQALQLDCRSLDFHYFPIETTGYEILLLDTGVKHSLASSEYNTRRKECEEGVRLLQKKHPEVKSLRDADLEMLAGIKDETDTNIYHRCLYVVEENQRVLDAAKHLSEGNLKAFGDNLYGSHAGLSQLYEVSCAELDYLVDFTKSRDEVLGARMMGGGFGGCTINLVNSTAMRSFIAEIQKAYQARFQLELKAYPVNIVEGTSIFA